MKTCTRSFLSTLALITGLNFFNFSTAQALEIFGTCLVGECNKDIEDSGFIDPKSYDVTFNVTGPEDLQTAIQSKSEVWRGRSKAVAGSAGVVARAKGDYKRLLAALYDNGHYAGSISIKLNGVQASKSQLGEELPQNSQIVIDVDPGPAYRFGTARIVNAAPPNFERRNSTPSALDIGFFEGEIAKASTIRRAARNARDAWRQHGHAKASIESRRANALHNEQKLNVSIEVAPGPKSYFGEVNVTGAKTMNSEFVAYMTGLHAGIEYDPAEIRKAQKRLERLGIFASQKIDESASLDQNGLLPLNVVVSERKARRIGIGATLSSLDGAGLETFWLHRNLFGNAERLRLDGKVSGIGNSFDPDEFDYLVSATLTQPGIFTPDTDLTWNWKATQDFNPTFRETATEASATLTNFVSDEITVSGGVAAKYGEYQDIFGTRRFFTTGFEGEVTYDNRDNKADPTSGFFGRINANPFYEWEFGDPAIRFEAEGRTYFALDKRGYSVLAARAKLGSLIGQSLSLTSPDLLFTAGGGSSVRGFNFKGIGVETPVGLSGGRSLAEGSLEFRQRFTETLGAVAFIDAGNVSSEQFTDFSNDFRLGAGIGLRYYTSLGPIRVDIATPIDRRSGESSFALYAGIGQAF